MVAGRNVQTPRHWCVSNVSEIAAAGPRREEIAQRSRFRPMSFGGLGCLYLWNAMITPQGGTDMTNTASSKVRLVTETAEGYAIATLPPG